MKRLLLASACLAMAAAPAYAQNAPQKEQPGRNADQNPGGGTTEMKPPKAMQGQGEQKRGGATEGQRGESTAPAGGQGEPRRAESEKKPAQGQTPPRAETQENGAAGKGEPGQNAEAPRKAGETSSPAKAEEQRRNAEPKATGAEKTEPHKTSGAGTEQRKPAGNEAGTAKGGAAQGETQKGETQRGEAPKGENAPPRQETGGTNQPAAQGGAARANQAGQRNGGGGSARVEGRLNLDPGRAGDFHRRIVDRYRGEETNVNVDIRVGAGIPETVHLRPLPTEIVDEYPEFRGYDFFVEQDEVVVVDPRSRDIVEVIGGGGETVGSAGGSRRSGHFGRQQDEVVRRVVTSDSAILAGGGRGPVLRAPASAEIRPLPERIAADMPDAGAYGYFVDAEGRVVIVDRSNREVVDIVDR